MDVNPMKHLLEPAWLATKIAIPKIWQEKIAKTRARIFAINLA